MRYDDDYAMWRRCVARRRDDDVIRRLDIDAAADSIRPDLAPGVDPPR